MQSQLPHTFQLIKDGQESLLCKIVEDTFHLLGSLQHHCLPLDTRNMATQHYIAMQKHEQAASTLERYTKWKSKEASYLKKALEKVGLESVLEEDAEFISDVRLSVFALIYEEQHEAKQEHPFSSFLSIFDANGQRNYCYAQKLAKTPRNIINSTQAKKRLELSQERRKKLDECFKMRLDVNGVKYDKKFDDLVRDVTIADRQAIFMRAYEEGIALGDADSFLLDIVMSDLDEANLEYWKSIKASIITDKKWEKYSEREAAIFEEIFEMSKESFTKEEALLYETVRAVYFRLIHEEQVNLALPFVSIFNSKGGMNDDFWIDYQDARAKMRKERPFDDNRHLKEFSDFDVVCINAAPAKMNGGSLEDSTGVRETGSVVKEFCKKVLEELKNSADGIKGSSRSSQVGDDVDTLIFKQGEVSIKNQLIVVQDAFCAALANTHFIRGFSAIVLKKMDISFIPTSPRVLPIQKEEEHPLIQKCTSLAREIQNIKTLDRPITGAPDEHEEVAMQLQIYGSSMDSMANELKRMGMILQGFASGLRMYSTSPRNDHLKPKMHSSDSIIARPTPKLIKTGSMKELSDNNLETKQMPRVFTPTITLMMPRIAALQKSPSPRIDSPRVLKMNPDKFEEVSKLLMSVCEIFKEAAKLILDDCEKLKDAQQMESLGSGISNLVVDVSKK